MSEYSVSTGLIWIRPAPGEKPIWVGGDWHEPPPREIAHRFANTIVDQQAVGKIMEDVYVRTRREMADAIERALRRYDATYQAIVEGSIAS